MDPSQDKKRVQVFEGRSPDKLLRYKSRGQAIIIIAFAMMGLMGVVGLAVDGGNTYVQRRQAQNGADGAALAGTRTMLRAFEDTTWANDGELADGTDEQELEVSNAITDYATANGILTSTLKAYFVTDSKQIVGNVTVGQWHYIPFTAGAVGIMIKAQSQRDSFFIRLFGYDKITAEATTTAFMGPATESSIDFKLLPIGFFTDTEHAGHLVNGHTYTLIAGNKTYTSGNWGFLDFNGQGTNVPVVNAWIVCGFSPALTTGAEWAQWCTDQRYSGESRAVGPTMYFVGWPHPVTDPLYAPRVEWKDFDGSGPDWWFRGSTGISSSCSYFQDLLRRLNEPQYYLPMFDVWEGSGTNTYFHLLALPKFQFDRNSIDCRSPNQDWSIQGTFIQDFAGGSSGKHGDLVNTSAHSVFLEP